MLSVDLGPARFSQHKTEDGWLRAVCALALNGWNMIATSVHEEVGAWCGRLSEPWLCHWGISEPGTGVLPLCNACIAFLLAHSCQTSPSVPKACKSCLLYLENDGWTYLGIGI